MTIPVWPDILPRTVSQEGFSYGFGDGRLKTAMDAGPGKSRRRFSAVVKPVSAQIILDEDGLRRLETFWEVDTKGGTLPFKMPNLVYQKLLLRPDGQPLLPQTPPVRGLPWLVMFAGNAPQVGPFGGLLWRVSFTLSVLR